MKSNTIIAVLTGSLITLTAVLAAGRSPLGSIFDPSSAQEYDVATTGLEFQAILNSVDFDQDGFDDILGYHQCVNGVNSKCLSVYLNQSGQSFVEVFSVNEDSIPGYVDWWKPMDVNGDGYPDLVYSPGNGKLQVWINQLGIDGYACATDHDKSGDTGVGDLLFILDRWGACAS